MLYCKIYNRYKDKKRIANKQVKFMRLFIVLFLLFRYNLQNKNIGDLIQCIYRIKI